MISIIFVFYVMMNIYSHYCYFLLSCFQYILVNLLVDIKLVYYLVNIYYIDKIGFFFKFISIKNKMIILEYMLHVYI